MTKEQAEEAARWLEDAMRGAVTYEKMKLRAEVIRRAAIALRAHVPMVEALTEAQGEMPTCTRPDCQCAWCLTGAALALARPAGGGA